MADTVLIPEPLPTPDQDPDAPAFVVTNAQWNRMKDAAGKFLPTLKEYWPQITAVIIATGLVSAGVAHVATKNAEPPIPAPTPVVVPPSPAPIVVPVPTPAPLTDFKPVIDAINNLGMDIKQGNADLKTDIANMAKKIDEKPIPVPADPVDPAAQTVLPISVDAKVGRQTVISAKATGDVYWAIPTGTPCDTDINGSKVTIVPHADAASFPIGVFTQNKSKWSITWTMVKAGTAPQPPPIVPPTPIVVDPFVKSLQDAYVLDGKPAAALSKLVNIYSLAPAIINNPVNKYPIDIVKVNGSAITNSIEPGAPKTVLVNVRTVIDMELRKFLPLGPGSDAELTDVVRTQFLTQYARVATALKGVQP